MSELIYNRQTAAGGPCECNSCQAVRGHRPTTNAGSFILNGVTFNAEYGGGDLLPVPGDDSPVGPVNNQSPYATGDYFSFEGEDPLCLPVMNWAVGTYGKTPPPFAKGGPTENAGDEDLLDLPKMAW